MTDYANKENKIVVQLVNTYFISNSLLIQVLQLKLYSYFFL